MRNTIKSIFILLFLAIIFSISNAESVLSAATKRDIKIPSQYIEKANNINLEDIRYLKKKESDIGEKVNNSESLNSKPLISDKKEKKAENSEYVEKLFLLKSFPLNLKQFGYDLFSNAGNLLFTPLENIPVAGDYVLGPGDELKIYIWGNIQQDFSVFLDSEGYIILPKAGKISLVNVRLDEAKSLIKNALKQHFANFSLDVTMGKLKTIEVHVLGEVKFPGKYNLPSLSTIMHALYASSGPKRLGSLRNIKLIRNNKKEAIFDLYDLLLKGDKSKDLGLKSGDTIFVSRIGDLVAIKGDVKSSGIYEMKNKTTLYDLMSMAGNSTRTTYLKEINITRRDYGTDIFTLKTVSFETEKDYRYLSKRIYLNNGDIVEVKSVDNSIYDWVKIEGAVARPGSYSFTKKAKTLQDLLEISGGLLNTAYNKRIEIYRPTSHNNHVIIPVDLAKDKEMIISLNEFDVVKVYFNNDVFLTYNTTIIGEVNKPGKYNYYEDMTLQDLIFSAGNLNFFADNEGYILRLVNSLDQQIISIDVTSEKDLNIKLEPYDKVYVPRTSSYRVAGSVSVKGEVNHPGVYPIYKNETLSQFIDRIGGFTMDSYIPGFKLHRKIIKTSNLDKGIDLVDDHKEFAQKISDVNFNRVIIDHESIFNNKEKLFLRDGDILEAIKEPQTVSIIGGVYNQGAFLFKENKGMLYFLKKAGKFKKNADKEEIYIVHIDGTVTKTNDNNYEISRGDTIVIPIKEFKEIDFVKVILDTTKIIFNVATVWKIVFS